MYFGTLPFWNGGHESAGVNAPPTQLVPRRGRDGSVLRHVHPAVEPERDAGRRDAAPTCSTRARPSSRRRSIPAERAARRSTSSPKIRGWPTPPSPRRSPPICPSSRSARCTGRARSQLVRSAQQLRCHRPEHEMGVCRRRRRESGRDSIRLETYILINNPNPSAFEVTVTYLRVSGAPIVKTYQWRSEPVQHSCEPHGARSRQRDLRHHHRVALPHRRGARDVLERVRGRLGRWDERDGDASSLRLARRFQGSWVPTYVGAARALASGEWRPVLPLLRSRGTREIGDGLHQLLRIDRLGQMAVEPGGKRGGRIGRPGMRGQGDGRRLARPGRREAAGWRRSIASRPGRASRYR